MAEPGKTLGQAVNETKPPPLTERVLDLAAEIDSLERFVQAFAIFIHPPAMESLNKPMAEAPYPPGSYGVLHHSVESVRRMRSILRSLSANLGAPWMEGRAEDAPERESGSVERDDIPF